jgi:hypothetical protein
MTTKNPLALVKEQFGDKAKLVAAVEKFTGDDLWVARTNKDKGLAHVSNAKLLRLHATFTEVKAKFGTREKLIDAILEQQKRTKDAGMRQRLMAWPVPRLYDTYKSAAKRAAVASKAASAAPKKVEAAPKAAAKKTAAAAKPANANANANAKKTAAKKAST